MKIKCKQCNQKHNRVTIDLMSATKMPHLFCSDGCEENFKMAESMINRRKQIASIRVSNPYDLKPGMQVTLDGTVCEIENIKGNVVEVFRYQSIN